MVSLKNLMLYAPVLAAITMTAVALWLLRAGKGRESSRAFSLVLIARAGSLMGLTLFSVTESLVWIRVGSAFYIGFAMITAVAVIYFVLVYPKRWSGLPRQSFIQVGILLLTIILAVAVWIRPDLANPTGSPDGTGVVDVVIWAFSSPTSPIGFGPTLLDFVMAGSAFFLVRDYLMAEPGRGRDTLRLVALGFFAPASCSCMVAGLLLKTQAGIPPPTNPSLFNMIEMGLFGGWALLLLVILVYLVVSRRTRVSGQRGARIFLAVVLIATAVGMSTALVSDLENRIISINAMLAFWSTLGAALVAHGVMRLNLFDIDVRFKVTMRRSTVAAIFVAFYFLVSEISATWFGNVVGSDYWGIAGAAVLLLALHPIQSMAKRLANRLMPSAQPLRDLDQSKQLEFYRQQVDLMWMDGNLSLTDRKVLANLRSHLGLDPETAEAVELEVIANRSEHGTDTR